MIPNRQPFTYRQANRALLLFVLGYLNYVIITCRVKDVYDIYYYRNTTINSLSQNNVFLLDYNHKLQCYLPDFNRTEICLPPDYNLTFVIQIANVHVN